MAGGRRAGGLVGSEAAPHKMAPDRSPARPPATLPPLPPSCCQPASQRAAHAATPDPTGDRQAGRGSARPAVPKAETPEHGRKPPGATESWRGWCLRACTEGGRTGGGREVTSRREWASPGADAIQSPGCKKGARPAMVEKEKKGGAAAGVGAPGAVAAAIISEEEAAQYDRQIRLWGLEAQKRLRASRVLLVGMKGLGAEVAKNLILAGVKALTMLDHQQVSPEDMQAQFLVPAGSLGKNRAEASLERAQDLNPMVDVKADPENVELKAEEFFTCFDVVCLTCCSQEVLVKVDQICHKNGIKFFTGDVFGYHGYMFANLGEHEFVEEKMKVAKASQGVEDGPDKKKAKLDFTETTLVKKRVNFCLLKEALTVSWSSEKAKATLKRTTSDYFLLQGPVSAGCSPQQLLLLRWHEGQRNCGVPAPELRLGQDPVSSPGATWGSSMTCHGLSCPMAPVTLGGMGCC
ncbi:SUMO-activating enzyme subunit 1 isoform X2 [Rhineura floridana]|uniref:SUMO-activating enzyme subunit 1 isoform X2 n=1 Tax=Rhineura floridana TaxID=261503 RepID=UPI002AC84498|nr:SUMO-activating enzyme subunit 1 isoform X2 [Rhineura floridana]